MVASHTQYLRDAVTLVLAYCMGLLALACSMVRLRNIIHFNGEGDFTYIAAMVPVWGAVECNAGIICGMHMFPVRPIQCIQLLTLSSIIPIHHALDQMDKWFGQ